MAARSKTDCAPGSTRSAWRASGLAGRGPRPPAGSSVGCRVSKVVEAPRNGLAAVTPDDDLLGPLAQHRIPNRTIWIKAEGH